MKKSVKGDLLYLVGFVIGLFLVGLITAWPFSLMWNYAVVKAIDMANPIDYWTAYWLSIFWAVFISSSRYNDKK